MAERSKLSKIALAVAIAAAFAVLMTLGTWQVQRLHWKEALIASANERPGLPPVPAPGPDSWSTLDMDDWQYRAVALTGSFGSGESLYFINLSDARGPMSGTGYFVIAPFETADGWTVLVNRGFVPERLTAVDARPADAAPPAGPLSLSGILRPNDPANWFQPLPEEGSGTFLTRDIEGMAAAIGVTGPLAPYQVDLTASATPEGGAPQAGEWRIAFSNNHLAYAITWYGIGAGLVLVVALSLRKARRSQKLSA